MDRPLVTVVVLAYKHERYVEQALDSVLANQWANLQVIISNDASPANDDPVIRGWIARHPDIDTIYVRHDLNQGVVATLNECVGLARGEFIVLLAADDLLEPDAIAKRVGFLEEHPHKLAVFTDCSVIDEHGNRLLDSAIEQLKPRRGMRRAALRIDRLVPYEIVFHWAVPGPVFACRRELYDLVGRYDTRLSYVEDWDMYLRIASVGRLGYLDEPTARYRVHAASVMNAERSTPDQAPPKVLEDYFATARRAAPRFLGLQAVYLHALARSESLEPARAPMRVRKWRRRWNRQLVRWALATYDRARAVAVGP